jgi:hypothetical protein
MKNVLWSVVAVSFLSHLAFASTDVIRSKTASTVAPSNSLHDDSTSSVRQGTKETNFAELINDFHLRFGKPGRQPWVGYSWPYIENGIASKKFGNVSPAEKYDATHGGQTHAYDWETKYHGAHVHGAQNWWSHIGASASVLYPEPRKSVTVNGVTFTPSDIKALLVEASENTTSDFWGQRVDWRSDYSTSKFDDVSPDEYFLVLTHYMGKLKHGVVIDRYTGDQVANVPLAGYSFEYPAPSDYYGEDPKHPGQYIIHVVSTLWWAKDDVSADKLTSEFKGVADESFARRVLEFNLWLDAPVIFDEYGNVKSSGNIIVRKEGDAVLGGEWLGDANDPVNGHPDFMWVPYTIDSQVSPESTAEDITLISMLLGLK